MLNKFQFYLLTGIAVVVLILAITNIILFTGNREAQNEHTARTQYIQQSLQLEPIYQGIVRNLAETAAKTGDTQISQLLTSQGITFTVNQPPSQDAPKADPAKNAKEKK